jgi:allophanate hydrolase subunit 1
VEGSFGTALALLVTSPNAIVMMIGVMAGLGVLIDNSLSLRMHKKDKYET